MFRKPSIDIKTPQFWHRNGLVPQLLLPLSVVYFLAKRISLKKSQPKKFNLKVICIGNVIAGGAGKTPTAIAVYKELSKLHPKAKIAFITTGYKGKLYGPVEVDGNKHSFKDVGDEALMLSKYGKTIVCKERVKSLELAQQLGFQYAILDDGLHDNTIHKDISFLVIDGAYGFGNGLLMPAGPLRDRLDYAVEGVDHIILIGDDKKKVVTAVNKFGRKEFPVIKASTDHITKLDEALVYIAFAGIGRPQKFFDMLKQQMKLVLAETVEFADHHNYSKSDIEHLQTIAKDQKAKLITTEKDYIKLPSEFAAQVDVVKIELKFEDKALSKILN